MFLSNYLRMVEENKAFLDILCVIYMCILWIILDYIATFLSKKIRYLRKLIHWCALQSDVWHGIDFWNGVQEGLSVFPTLYSEPLDFWKTWLWLQLWS